MKYTPTKVAGVTIIDLELRRDHRGFTWRSFCARDFAAHGLNLDVAQTNIVFNYTRGTVRGLHRTVPPHAEATLLRCTRGAIVAAAVDVRPDSLTYGDHVMIELAADDHRTLFLPPYVAHGFQTLVDDTEVTYHTSGRHAAAEEQGLRWDDPEFGVTWPIPVTVISEEDASWPSAQTRLAPMEQVAPCLSR
ncbi:dTDP-4-dehydrorhamnose 3,5-epimerase family protein [Mycobacterium avium]|uniref:dTDP-4-dehydrorhamnose 3,5-epimerase family protein n=1 Tax=Mycobacterium avium TaxID=1764 RepID=UPI001CDAE640|nr:dTDP-4-dehydrorhamnose 3,5-epimerase family protein [Mycobacterium avium]MCA2257293.1 dTDP-4-dehydrorhamnose 3,5-epimerase family protein [Mycobacterium avium]MCA2277231.1 dTDP-4-dehydrorhamnose 3,5-epimerase family protein [Mycobacterium avium]